MQIIQHGIGYDLHYRDGACHSEIATYDPGYEECSETAGNPPGQGFDDTTEMAVIQLQQHHLGSACALRM